MNRLRPIVRALRRIRSSRLAWVALGVMLLLPWTWSAWESRQRSALRVITGPVTMGAIARRVVAAGTLEAVTTVQVGAQVSGTIQSIAADYNAFVHAGQVVATLDPALFDAALREASAALAAAEATLAKVKDDRAGAQSEVEDATMKLRRAKALAAGHLIPQSDLDAAQIAMGQAAADLGGAESQVTEARAAVVQAGAAREQAKVSRDRTVITLPIDGIVVARNVDVGQTVAAAVQAPVLFAIASDLGRMRVEVDVDESDVGGITQGDLATFDVESYPDETFVGSVSQVRLQPIAEQTTTASLVGTSTAPSVSSDVPTVISYAVMIDVPNPRARLRPGMTAIVALNGSRREQVLRIPNGALSFRPSIDVLRSVGEGADVMTHAHSSASKATVWRFNGSAFTPIEVRVGLADGEWTEVTEGAVHPRDPLVTSARLQRPSG